MRDNRSIYTYIHGECILYVDPLLNLSLQPTKVPTSTLGPIVIHGAGQDFTPHTPEEPQLASAMLSQLSKDPSLPALLSRDGCVGHL